MDSRVKKSVSDFAQVKQGSTLQAGRIKILFRNGMEIETPSFTISLDPRAPSDCDYTFVSHAHIDHVHTPSGKSKIIASSETAKLASLRGYNLGESFQEACGIELFDSGHILGSKAILIDDRLFYTGDISSRRRAFLDGCRGVHCETLIMETTYGRGHYRFPEISDVVMRANQFISRCFDKGRPVILTGYPLGKAQILTSFFQKWEPAYLHDSVRKMNLAHIEMEVDLKDFPRFENGSKHEAKIKNGPWLLIAPMSGGQSNLIKDLKQKYGAAVAAFSGWAVDPSYKYRMGFDEAFPVSDHCDFNELTELVKRCGPSTVYTVHGFAGEFATHLRSLGFEAQALSESINQDKISNYA